MWEVTTGVAMTVTIVTSSPSQRDAHLRPSSSSPPSYFQPSTPGRKRRLQPEPRLAGGKEATRSHSFVWEGGEKPRPQGAGGRERRGKKKGQGSRVEGEVES